MNIQLTQPQWIELDPEVKSQLINIFKIPRTEPTKITQGYVPGKGQVTTVHSDGHSHKDLSVITVEKMQEYLGNYETTDFYALFSQVLNRLSVDKGLNVEAEVKKVETENIAKWTTLLIDLRNKATELNLLDDFTKLVSEIFNVQPISEAKATKTVKGTKKGK